MNTKRTTMTTASIIQQLLDIMAGVLPTQFKSNRVDELWDKCNILQAGCTWKELQVVFELAGHVDTDKLCLCGEDAIDFDDLLEELDLQNRPEDSPRVFDVGMFGKKEKGYIPKVWKDKCKTSIKGYGIDYVIVDGPIGPERSTSMLVRVAIIERVKDDNGNPLTPVVIVPAEDVPMVTTDGIREKMLVKYATKLKDKDLRQVEVVCSDFVSRRG